jgi:hypothetical protein
MVRKIAARTFFRKASNSLRIAGHYSKWRCHDWSGGWTIDDCRVWNRDGRLLAIARQQRKMLG